jgi:glycosyltransferase involved in cell wall biosynthesis
MNILFLTQTYPRFATDTSGPFIQDLARGLVRGGDRVTVLAPHAEGLPATRDDDGVMLRTFRYAPERWELLGYSRSLERDESMKAGALLVTPLYLLAAWRALSRELSRAPSREPSAGGAREARPYDLVHAHWVVPNGPPAWPVARRTPLAIGLHGSDVFLAERPGARTLVRAVLRRTRLLTGCSPELVERVAALGPGPAWSPERAAERCRVIPYGVDVERFAPDPARRPIWRRRLGVPDGAPLVLSVGRMATKKGYHVLMEALPELLRRHPEAHFVLAGGGDRLEEWRRRAAELDAGSERIHFPGVVRRDTLPDLYRAADLFVLPAVHDPKGNVDGLPNVILEAMATGLPVVASGISGIPLAVVPEETGLLVPEQDRSALVSALSRLLDDSAARRAWGDAARRRAERELTWDAVATRYREGYEAALDGSGS